MDDGTDKAVVRREGGGLDAGPGALTWSVREPAEKRVFPCLFLNPCYRDPTRSSLRVTLPILSLEWEAVAKAAAERCLGQWTVPARWE